MEEKTYSNNIICALATPPGRGAISVIRVSGENCWEKLSGSIDLDKIKSHKAFLVDLKDKEKRFIDETLITFFAKGKSFTGEESFEISCHGSPLVVQDIISHLYSLGIKHAEPGEFSYRAFLNGKIDLIKAEGIHHTIHSESDISKGLSLNLLSGNLKNEILEIKEDLLFVASRLEASIDFSDQDIDLDHDHLIMEKVNSAYDKLKIFADSYKVGSAQRKGLKISLVGPPNSGKSSLFNKLLKQNRSIVSDIEGTTRDFVSETLYLKGCPVEVVDTAGIRETEELIESEGIKRSIEASRDAQLILFLIAEENFDLFEETIKPYKDLEKNILVAFSKQDIKPWSKSIEGFNTVNLSVEDSSIFNVFVGKLENVLKPYLRQGSHLFVARHFELISSGIEALEALKALPGVASHEDIAATLAYNAISSLDDMLYVEDLEQVRDKIFKEFCLGK